MSNLFDYARICLFERFPRNLSLAKHHIEEAELLAVFRHQFDKILTEFDVSDKLPLNDYTLEIFNELFNAGLIDRFEDPLAGEFYWTNMSKVAAYMEGELKKSDIFERKMRLAGDKLYQAVFSRLIAGDIDAALDPVDETVSSDRTLRVKATLSESERAEFVGYLAPMRNEVEGADISQEQRVDALAALDAIEKLSEAPNPLWQVIALILSSPILSNVTAIAALAISILKP